MLGVCGGKTYRSKQRLPQGDPCSPLRLAAIMAAWVWKMKQRFPGLGLVVYLDDRIIWTTGEDAVKQLKLVLAHNLEIEGVFALKDNQEKRALFANMPRGIKEIKTEFPGTKVDKTVLVLGVKYTLHGKEVKANLTDQLGKAMRRTKRIEIAGGSIRVRRVLIGCMVLSLFA